MTMKPAFRAALVLAILSGISVGAQAKCADDYNTKYAAAQIHKAFAMTAPGSALRPGYNGPSYSCGWSLQQPTLGLAVQTALTFCEAVRVRADRRGRCRIVARQ